MEWTYCGNARAFHPRFRKDEEAFCIHQRLYPLFPCEHLRKERSRCGERADGRRKSSWAIKQSRSITRHRRLSHRTAKLWRWWWRRREQQLGTHKKFIFSEHFRSKSFVSLNQARSLNFYGGSSVTHCVKCHKVLGAGKKFSTQEVAPDEERSGAVINIH